MVEASQRSTNDPHDGTKGPNLKIVIPAAVKKCKESTDMSEKSLRMNCHFRLLFCLQQ